MRELMIAAILGLVEGATEFVPVSSTGHLIVAGHLLGFRGERAATFQIFIQLGAMLAVALCYRKRFRSLLRLEVGEGVSGLSGWVLLALTTLPALAAGVAAHGPIKTHLFTPTAVAAGWAIGGVGLLLIERVKPPAARHGLEALRWPHALAIGAWQCLALWPGVSRSAATITGGMAAGVGRATAAEYSFLAAVPVLGAAAVFDVYQSRHMLAASDLPVFAVGFLVAFASAWVSMRSFLRLLAKTTLRPFGWYRIGLALLLLAGLAGSRWTG